MTATIAHVAVTRPDDERGSHPFAGTALLSRFILRRDRIRLLIWIVVLVALPASTASAYEGLYPTAAERAGLDAQFGATRALGLITGPAVGLDTPGGFVEWRLGATLAAITGIFAAFHVVRHTRTEEESGRAELTYATAVGRYAPLTSAVLTLVATLLVIGLLIGATLAGPADDVGGSIGFGLATAASGLVFGALAAMAAQLATTARTATSIAVAGIAAAFVLRGIADSADVAWPKWISPIGWSQLVVPFGEYDARVLLLHLALATVLLGAAFGICDRRDVGAGVITPSPGPADASPRLRSMWSLGRRLHTPSLIGWLVGVVIAGALMGSLINAVSDIADTSPQMREIIEQIGGASGITAAFIAMAAQIVAIIVSLYAVSSILTARTEESTGRAELLLGTPVSRLRWLGAHVGHALIGQALLMVAFGVTLALAAHAASASVSFGVVMGSALVQLPAIFVMSGVAAVIVAWIPAWSVLAWVASAVAIGLTLFGAILDLPAWVQDISPFTSVPDVTEAGTSWTPIVVLSLIAAGLLCVAGVGMRRRDFPT